MVAGMRAASSVSPTRPGVAACPLPRAPSAARLRTTRSPRKIGWTEGNPLKYFACFIFFDEGDIVLTTREILRKAEKDLGKRRIVHVG